LKVLSAVPGFSGCDLEDEYKSLQKEYDRSESRAPEVREWNSAVENVAEPLFHE